MQLFSIYKVTGPTHESWTHAPPISLSTNPVNFLILTLWPFTDLLLIQRIKKVFSWTWACWLEIHFTKKLHWYVCFFIVWITFMVLIDEQLKSSICWRIYGCIKIMLTSCRKCVWKAVNYAHSMYLHNKLGYQLDNCFTKLAQLLTTVLLIDLLLSFDSMLIYSYIYSS